MRRSSVRRQTSDSLSVGGPASDAISTLTNEHADICNMHGFLPVELLSFPPRANKFVFSPVQRPSILRSLAQHLLPPLPFTSLPDELTTTSRNRSPKPPLSFFITRREGRGLGLESSASPPLFPPSSRPKQSTEVVQGRLEGAGRQG